MVLNETPRLAGEPLGRCHQAELARLLGDPRAGEMLGGAKTADEALGFAYEKDFEHAGLPNVLYRLHGAPA